jgi:hypothetical protein
LVSFQQLITDLSIHPSIDGAYFSSRILLSAHVVFVTENESIHIKTPTYGDYLAGLKL